MVRRQVVAGPGTRLVLASSSPRRRALLDALGVDFEVVEPGVGELTEGDPAAVVTENALRKARAVAERRPEAIVIGADTDVVIDGEILGKPADEAAARSMLERLCGREHDVHGGVAICGPGREQTAHELTTVRFRAGDKALIDAYIAAGSWRGYAGAYAIQGAGSVLVDHVEGELANVIGMPLRALIGLLPELLDR